MWKTSSFLIRACAYVLTYALICTNMEPRSINLQMVDPPNQTKTKTLALPERKRNNMAATPISIVRPGTLHIRNVARAEQRESKVIGKMGSSQIMSYLLYRHRGMLLTTALIATNVLWLLHYHQ